MSCYQGNEAITPQRAVTVISHFTSEKDKYLNKVSRESVINKYIFIWICRGLAECIGSQGA